MRISLFHHCDANDDAIMTVKTFNAAVKIPQMISKESRATRPPMDTKNFWINFIHQKMNGSFINVHKFTLDTLTFWQWETADWYRLTLHEYNPTIVTPTKNPYKANAWMALESLNLYVTKCKYRQYYNEFIEYVYRGICIYRWLINNKLKTTRKTPPQMPDETTSGSLNALLAERNRINSHIWKTSFAWNIISIKELRFLKNHLEKDGERTGD
jgi:hypothetical protein